MSAVPPLVLPVLVLINKFLGDFMQRLFRVACHNYRMASPRGPYANIRIYMGYIQRQGELLYDPAKSPLSEAFNYIRRCCAVGVNPLVIGYFQFPFARSYISQFRICFKLCAQGPPGESFIFFSSHPRRAYFIDTMLPRSKGKVTRQGRMYIWAAWLLVLKGFSLQM